MAGSFALNTGASIPAIGLGTWHAQPGVVGDAIYAAVKAGYCHIECAPSYGNEKEVGLALTKLFQDGVVKREDLFITSKLWYCNNAPEYVPEAIQTTLDDLQLEYLDLYLIHGPIRLKKGTAPLSENSLPCDIPATWAAMEKLHEAGKARAIGVSNFSCRKLESLLAVTRVPPAVNQVACHPGWQQAKLRDLCKSTGVHLSAYSPLEPQRTPAQVALRWGLQMGQSVLPKSTDVARIKENLDVFDWCIPEELMAEMLEIEQVKLLRAEFGVHPVDGYKSLEDL
ncbi:hypothetical protein QOZ80_5BG0418360 [Eleusine coracana subsp. coracana]|nr:hypothetical protein QOZ80_5BG0418360 [Eleusine coracana subsp. coracana]